MLRKYWRALKKYYLLLLRSDGTPHKIAQGVGLGIFIGCFAPLGTHTVIVLLLAFIFKTNKLTAFAGTWIVNQFTAPILYPIFCYTGAKLLFMGLTFSQIKSDLVMHNFTHDFFHSLAMFFHDLGIPFFLGGFIYGVIFALIGYFITYKLISRHRLSRHHGTRKRIQQI